MLTFFVSLVLLSGPLPGESSNLKNTPQSSLELMEMDLKFGAASATRGLEGWLSFFAEDASIFPPGKGIITGIEKIREFYEASGFDPKSLSWKPVKADISSTGDMGYTMGYWEIKADGAASSARGKYVTVWKKHKDGSWKVAADIGNR